MLQTCPRFKTSQSTVSKKKKNWGKVDLFLFIFFTDANPPPLSQPHTNSCFISSSAVGTEERICEREPLSRAAVATETDTAGLLLVMLSLFQQDFPVLDMVKFPGDSGHGQGRYVWAQQTDQNGKPAGPKKTQNTPPLILLVELMTDGLSSKVATGLRLPSLLEQTRSWIQPREFFSMARSYGYFKRGQGGGEGGKEETRRVFHSTFKRKTTFSKAGEAIHFLRQAILGRERGREFRGFIFFFLKKLICGLP